MLNAKSAPTPQYVDNPAELERLCQTLALSSWLAMDTEFLRESTYYPKLCLLQIAGEGALACVDPLRLSDLSPLWRLIYSPAKLKILHAGRQDLEILYHLHGQLPKPVFDTQLAASLLGYPEQIGYAQLVAEVLGITLDKSHTRSNWRQRPLDAKQIRYAIDDVRYLALLFCSLRDRLEHLGRWGWLEPEFTSLTDPATYASPPEEAWRRIKGAFKLNPRQLAILKRLAAWREEMAMASDRPRGWIINDDLLCQIARMQPKTPEALARLHGIEVKFIRCYGETLCQLVARTLADVTSFVPAQPAAPAPEQEALLDCLSALVKLQAAKHGLNPQALASRKDLVRFLACPEKSTLCQGWRRKVIGEELLAFLAGKRRFKIEEGSLCLI